MEGRRRYPPPCEERDQRPAASKNAKAILRKGQPSWRLGARRHHFGGGRNFPAGQPGLRASASVPAILADDPDFPWHLQDRQARRAHLGRHTAALGRVPAAERARNWPLYLEPVLAAAADSRRWDGHVERASGEQSAAHRD